MKVKLFLFILLVAAFLTASGAPVFAAEYNPGVAVGQYIRYGNFVGEGPGVEAFNDYEWLKLEITEVSGKEVTLLSTSQYKNGTAIPGSGDISVWNIETGMENGAPSVQGPIIAADLNQGDPIPPPDTYTVNRTETRTYLGITRTVNVLDLTLSTPDYTVSLLYVYDRASGMLLESTTQTTPVDPQSDSTTVSYSAVETNLFESTTNPPGLPILLIVAVVVVVVAVVVLVLVLLTRRKH